MRRAALAALAVAAATGCASSGGAAETAAPTRSGDVAALVEHVRRAHPDPWHAVSEATFLAAADRLSARFSALDADRRLVELMRLIALLGVRDGHSGIYPLDAHRQELHLLPVRLYAFADGVRVAGALGPNRDLVGARILALAGHPVADVAARVSPLVPADNDSSRRARLWQWAVVSEVLRGAGIAPDGRPVALRLELRDGGVVERELRAIPASGYARAFPDLFHPMVPQGLPRRSSPPFLARRNLDGWTATLAGGRVAYVAYNVTLGSSAGLAARLTALVRRRAVRGVVLDLRHNPGGENAAYEPLLRALVAAGQSERVVVLTSRTTFSAAANLLADLEARVPIRVVGQPSGGSPNLVGDPSPLGLEETGWTVNVGTVWWRKSRAGPRDPRLAFVPDVPVPLRWADLARGRDAALAAAVAEAARR